MSDPVFLSREQVLAYHAEQLRLFGGQAGVGDPGLLDSALSQPQNTYLYVSSADLFDLGAAYAFHIAKNHPFLDGNKRVALQCCLALLYLNGIILTLPPTDLYGAMIQLTTSAIDKSAFAALLRSHWRPREE